MGSIDISNAQKSWMKSSEIITTVVESISIQHPTHDASFENLEPERDHRSGGHEEGVDSHEASGTPPLNNHR